MGSEALSELDLEAINKTGSDQVKAISERVIEYKKKLELLKTKAPLNVADKLLVKQAREFADVLEAKKGAVELYQTQSKELLGLLKELNTEQAAVKNNSTQKRTEVADDVNAPHPLPAKLIPEDKNEKVTTPTPSQKESPKEIFADEKIAINSFLGGKEYFKDINITSAILKVGVVKGDTENDYLHAGYEADGWMFDYGELSNLNKFRAEYNSNTELQTKVDQLSTWKKDGYDLLYMINSISVIEKNGENKVLESLCDINSDGKVDNGDTGLISGKNVLDVINKNPKDEEKIIKNISEILGVEFKNKFLLFTALKSNPALKYDFFSQLNFLGMAGANLNETLIKGKSGITKSVETLGKNLLLGNKLIEALTPGFEAKYDEAIVGLEKKSDDPTLSIEDRNKIYELIAIYKGPQNKEKFIESFKMNGAGLLLSFVENNKGFGLGTSVSNSQIDGFIKENTGKFLNGMQINLGFTNSNGSFTPGVGVNFSSRDFESSENTKIKFNAGLFLVVPYIMGTINYNYNNEAIQNSGFKDFSESSKNVGLTANASTLANGLTLHWSKDKLEAIEKKEKQFSKFLDELFTGEFNPITAGATLRDNTNLSPEDKKYLQKFIDKVNKTLKLIGYEKLTGDHKDLAIAGVKNALLKEWKTGLFIQAQKDGTEFSGVGIGLQFVAGILPIITAGAKWTSNNISFVPDKQGAVLQSMSSTGLGKTKTNADVVSGADIIKDVSNFKRADLDTYLKANFGKFDGSTTQGYSPIAMRKPENYRSFANALFAGNMDDAFIKLEKLLSNDSILKNDKYIQNLLKQFKSTSTTEKAYIIAQFEDIIFKDKNTISQVLTDNKLWTGRESGLRSVYTESLVYDEIIKLRNIVRNSGIEQIANQDDAKDILGFVASYKIGYGTDGKKTRLASGEAAIPPGLASVIGGEKGIIDVSKNTTLVDHILSKTDNIDFFKITKSSLESLISKAYTGFKFTNEDQFRGFLKTGEINIGDKTVKIERSFVFFLYGQCANETLGLRIKSIDLGNGEPIDLSIEATGQIIPNIPVLTPTDYTIGVGLGGGEKTEPEKPVPTPPKKPEEGTTVPGVEKPTTPPPEKPTPRPPVTPPPPPPPTTPVTSRASTEPGITGGANSSSASPAVAPPQQTGDRL